MLLLSSIAMGLMVFCVCLIMKRIRLHNKPTPPNIIFLVLFVLGFNHLVLQGVVAGQWDIAISHLLSTYIGFGCYLWIVDDIAYYRSKHRERIQSLRMSQASEDDPNWSNYRP